MMPLCGSPVIDAGDPAFAPPPSTDARGLARVVGGRVDQGAVEVNRGTIQFSATTQLVAENGGTATITATRTGGADDPVSVNYAAADGTAKSAASGPGTPDYTATSGTLTWANGDSAPKSFTVAVADDTTFEGNETFTATLSSPTCDATLGTNTTQTVTIVDNDSQPSLSISNVAQAEGNSGTSNFVFTVSLSNPTLQTVTVNYTTANGTATAGSDYTASSGTLTFNPGQTSQTISVPVSGDTLSEGNEAFTVTLSSPTNATIAGGTGTGTITDDDPQPTLSVANASQNEGNSGTANMTFNVTLSQPSGQTVTVNYATSNGTAIAGSDYTATSGTLTFTPGQTAQTITVPIVGDVTNEANETFNVTLSAPANATLAGGPATGTIVNDDPVPSVSISSVSQAEGNSGATNMAFNVTLSQASGQTVTVNYATSDGTAVAGSDYTATSGTLTFAPGQTTQPINVPVIGDAANENDETFSVTLSAPSNVTIATGSGTGTILNDDPVPSLSINNASQAEGNSGTANMTFNVTLSQASGKAVTVNYATSDGTAAAGSDYTATSGTLTFAPGVTTQPINVPVIGDATNEPNESFSVTLSAPSNATVATSTANGTIVNDDGVPSLSIDSVAQGEGNSGASNMTFTVTLSQPSGQIVTVSYSTANGTAGAGSDYTATSGTLTFAPGATTQTINVPVIGDALNEPNETFSVTLSAPSNAFIAAGTGTGTILNDDGVPSLSINGVAQPEGNSGTSTMTFTVILSPASGQPVTVNYATANGTATAGSDYTATIGTLTFTPGQTLQTIVVPIIGDSTFEPDETFTVTLTGATNAAIASGTGIGTIQNDDAGNADVSVTQTPPAQAFATQNGTFAITVANGGPNAANNVVLTDAIPAGAAFIAATPSQGTCTGTTSVTCNLGALASGGSATVSLTVNFAAAGPATNTASVTAAPQPDSNPANNTSSAGVAVQATSAIPTLGETALMMLASILAAIGAWFTGRKT